MKTTDNKPSGHWALILEATTLVILLVVLAFVARSTRLRLVPAAPAGGGLPAAQPTSSSDFAATKWSIVTAAVETREAAALTPVRLGPTRTPDLRPTPTPYFGGLPYIRTDAGVIYWPAGLDMWADCYKGESPFPYWVENMWDQTDGPYYPWITAIAGGMGESKPPSQGAVFVLVGVAAHVCTPDTYFTPFQDGPVEIVAAEGHRLLLRSRNHGRYIWFDADAREFEEAVPTPTPTLTPTPEGGPRSPSDLGDYVLFALRNLKLGSDVRIETGNLGVNGGPDGPGRVQIDVGTKDRFGSNTTLSADSIAIGNDALVPGILFFNDLKAHPRAKVTGAKITPLELPLLVPPVVPTFSIDPEAEDLTVDETFPMQIMRGEYETITVRLGKTLQLMEGTYEFGSLIVEAKGRVECMNLCEVRVLNQVRVGPDSFLGMSRLIDPRGLTIYIARQGGVGFESLPRSMVEGLIYAPQADVVLGEDGKYMGTFLGMSVEVKTRAQLWQAASLGFGP